MNLPCERCHVQPCGCHLGPAEYARLMGEQGPFFEEETKIRADKPPVSGQHRLAYLYDDEGTGDETRD